MKKIFVFLCFVFSFASIFAQSHSSGTVSFQLGFDGAGHGTVYETKFNGTVLDRDSSAAVTTLFAAGAQFNVMKFLSVGLNVQTGKYIEDPENAEANGNKVNAFTFDVRVYPVNKDKFNWYLGFRYGISRLEINRLYTILGNKIPYYYHFSGSNLGAFTGFNWYFAGPVGMHFNLGYTGNTLLLDEFTINSGAQNISNYENHMWTKGASVTIGLSARIGGKD